MFLLVAFEVKHTLQNHSADLNVAISALRTFCAAVYGSLQRGELYLEKEMFHVFLYSYPLSRTRVCILYKVFRFNSTLL